MEAKKKISVLIVEDEPLIAASEKGFLESFGYRVTGIAASARETMNSIHTDRPDIILMDVMIGGDMDGIDTAQLIRKEINIPVIFLSAIDDEDTIERISSSESYGFIGKPFRGYQLSVVIKSALSRYSLERKLRFNEQKYRFIFENIHDVYFESTTDGLIKEISPSVQSLTGKPREQLLDHPLAEIIKDPLTLNTMMAVSSRKKRELFHDVSVSGPENETRICDIQLTPGFNSTGEAVKIVGTINDITFRKNVEEKILSAKNEIESLLLSITSVLIGVSRRDIVTHWNRAAETTFGKKGSEMIGEPITTAYISWEWDRVFEAISISIANDRSVMLKELKFKTEKSDDSERFLNIRITPIKNIDGILSGFMIVGDDITETRIMRIRMNQSLKMEAIGQLAAGVAHEINTPMQYINDNTLFIRESFNKIVTMIDLFNEHKEKDARTCIELVEKLGIKLDIDYAIREMPQAIEQTLGGISRITKIVQSMKQFSHPGAQQKEQYDINRMIEDVITLSRNEWKYVADLDTDLMPNIPPINCYPNALSQVLLNIIVNAAQAIEEKIRDKKDEKGTIRIRSEADIGTIIISVSDTGMGIPESIRQKIFDPFFTTKDVGKGTGQGLAISLSIIEDMHGGSITVKSITGEGTTFIISLPRESENTEKEDEV